MDNSARYKTDVYSLAKDICLRYKNNTLFYFEEETLTYGEFLSEIRKRAAFIQKLDVKKGDVVALMGVNSPAWCAAFIAIVAVGAAVLPIDINLKSEQVNGMVETVKARFAFASFEFQRAISKIPVYDIASDEVLGEEKDFRETAMAYDDVAAMLFTSGTTGAPKIVQLMHYNLLSVCVVNTVSQEYSENDVTLTLLPLFHVYALEACFLAPLVSGSSSVIVNSLKGPDIMAALGKYPITIFPAAPIMWELFFKALVAKTGGPGSAKYYLFMFFVKRAPVLRKLGLGFLVNKIFRPVHEAFGLHHRFFISGGAPLKKEYFVYFKNMGFNFMEGYGLSETTGPIAIPYYKEKIPGTVGNTTEGNEVKLKNINEDGIGEIWLRGAAVMKGYYNNPKANEEAFDDEGFFNTGDLGRLDKSNNLYITGRLKNVIVLDSGKNVYPEELEFYYKTSPLISEIAVFDKSKSGSAQLYAVVCPVAKSQNEYRKIRDAIESLNKGLPEYRRVHNFAVSLDELPKNSTRKVLYSEVKKLLDEGVYQTNESENVSLRDVLKGSTIREEELTGFFRAYFKKSEIFVNQTFDDFGVDSLSMIDIVSSLEEKFGIQPNVKELGSKENMGQVVAYLGSLESFQGESLDEKILKGPYKKKPRRFYNPLYNVFEIIVGFLSRRLWHVKIYNRERLNEENAIFIANHQSYLDIIWISFCIPSKQRKNIYVTGKRKFAFLRFLFPVFPVLYLDDTNSVDVLKANADLLRQGKSLFIFPEGTRTVDGNMGSFKSGAAYLAWNLKKKVVPIGINGAYEIWPRHKKMPGIFTKQHGDIFVGNTVEPEKFKSVEDMNAALEKTVKELVKNKQPSV